MLRPTMANESDRDRRERIDRVRIELTEEHLNPLHTEGVHIVRDGVEKLEAPNYADLYRRFGFRLDELADQCRGPRLDREGLRAGGGQAVPVTRRRQPGRREALGRHPHLPRAGMGSQFPKERMLPALEATLSDMGSTSSPSRTSSSTSSSA